MPATLEKPICDSNAASPQVKRPWRAVLACSLWALLAFTVLNITLFALTPAAKVNNTNLWSGTGSIDLALDDLHALKTKPNVVLLGSSLVMFPFWAMDKEMDPKIADIFHYHYSHTFEKLLAKAQVWAHPTVFNLAIFGQMASDGYIFLDQFLKGTNAPDVLIVGVAPRDFSDSDLATPMDTLTFKRLVNLSNFAHLAPLYLPTTQDKAQFVAEHLCFFYGHRWHLQHEVDKGVNKTYNTCLGTASGAKTETDAVGFVMQGNTGERWRNSILEYQRRYHNIDKHDLTVQMNFIAHALRLCRDRHIKLLVVNMPLTQINRDLLPIGFYSQFKSRIATICHGPGVKFVDLGSDPEFHDLDFWDTCHLNHLGGHKLVGKLVPVVADLEKEAH